jgi:uncharacterized protein YbaR (Trm112 family)
LKPWLLNILACPIDKHHPMEAYFYKWETPSDELEKINMNAGNQSKIFSKQYQQLAKQIFDGTISKASIEAIIDQTESRQSTELHANSLRFLKMLQYNEIVTTENILERFPDGIDILYRYLNMLEVEEGILRCPTCNRWYPIGSSVETIPELLPDDLRDEEKDKAWLRKWVKKIPESIKAEGKPFKI